jgi:hypothetical protein
LKLWPVQDPYALTLGTYGVWPLCRPLRLSAQAAATHWHVIGKSNSGKSNFLAWLALELLRAGFGVSILDPHGDLAKLVFARLVAQGTFADPVSFERITYLDLPAAERQGRYMPFNVLAQHGSSGAIATRVLEAFHRAWPELASGAATFDTLLPDCVELLLHNGLPITAMHQLLIEDGFREELLAQEADVDLVASFRNIYDKLRKADQVEYAGSVLRRARQLTRLELLKYGLSQPTMVVDWRQVIDDNRCLIVNLAVEDSAARRLLGCFLTLGAEHAAKARADTEPQQRRGRHYLIIDECQLFLAQSEETLQAILSETRKYGLFLTMSHQNYSQTSQRLWGALQNAGIEVAFKEGRDDAEHSARILGQVDTNRIKHEVADPERAEGMHPVFDPIAEQRENFIQELTDLHRGHAYIRLPEWRRRIPLLGRRHDHTLKLRTWHVPMPVLDASKREAIEAWYLERFFTHRSQLIQEQPEEAPVRRSGMLSSN